MPTRVVFKGRFHYCSGLRWKPRVEEWIWRATHRRGTVFFSWSSSWCRRLVAFYSPDVKTLPVPNCSAVSSSNTHCTALTGGARRAVQLAQLEPIRSAEGGGLVLHCFLWPWALLRQSQSVSGRGPWRVPRVSWQTDSCHHGYNPNKPPCDIQNGLDYVTSREDCKAGWKLGTGRWIPGCRLSAPDKLPCFLLSECVAPSLEFPSVQRRQLEFKMLTAGWQPLWGTSLLSEHDVTPAESERARTPHGWRDCFIPHLLSVQVSISWCL